MKSLYPLIPAALFLAPAFLFAVPSDNPVATHYAGDDGYPAWSDRIAWDNVIDMSAYTNGATEFERFENARDELHAQGGGVLYYPAGDYDFTDMPADGPEGRGLMLRSGVVLRGATPTGDRWARGDGGGEDGVLELPTRFHFGFTERAGTGVTPSGDTPRDWNFVGLIPSGYEGVADVHDIGVAWIHFAGAWIFWGFELDWDGTTTYADAGGWKSGVVHPDWADRVADGTYHWDFFAGSGFARRPVGDGAGPGRLVFGCVFEDSAPVNNAVMEARPNGNFGPDGYFTQKFGARIQVHGSEVFIANNVMPKSRRSFLYRQFVGRNPQQSNNANEWIHEEHTIVFDYNYVSGVDVNNELLNPFVPESRRTPDYSDNVYFLPGVVVQDNYVYNHGRKGFNIGGAYAVVRNNTNPRAVFGPVLPQEYGPASGQEYFMTMDGYVEVKRGGSGSISDTLSRAFDLVAGPLWVDGNTFAAARSFHANDGEGILCQDHGGTQLYSWAVTRNSGPEYMAGYNVRHYGSFWAWNQTTRWVGVVGGNTTHDVSVVGNTGADASTGSSTDPDGGLLECPSEALTPPLNVTAEIQGDAVWITYEDTTDHEIGYRIDRRIGTDGAWTAVAYRPRQSAAHPWNPPAWLDTLTPRGMDLYYRAVAINCADDDTGASAAVGPVRLPSLAGPPALPPGYEAWANALPAEARALTATPFGDGIPNLLRFALGAEAAAVSMAPHFLRVEERSGGMTLHFVRRTGFTEIHVETSSDLQNWESLPPGEDITFGTAPRDATSETVTVELDGWAAAEGRFFRLAVPLP